MGGMNRAVVLRRRPLVKLHRADCIDVMRAMRAESVHAIVTDPPYGISYQNKRAKTLSRMIVNDDRPYIWWFREAWRVLRPGGGLICFCRWDVQEAFRFAIELAGLSVRSQVIWDRKIHGMGDCKKTFAPRHDGIWFATKGRFAFPRGRPKSVIAAQSVPGAKRRHPTEKPTALMRTLVRAVTPPGGRVLDPFLGCWSTGEVCAQDRFPFVGIEIDGRYFRTAVSRIRQCVVGRGSNVTRG